MYSGATNKPELGKNVSPVVNDQEVNSSPTRKVKIERKITHFFFSTP